jgi:ABC-2 family transporter protein
MTVPLRAESLKLRSVPLPRLMLIFAALGAGFIAFVVVHTANSEHTTVSPTNLVTAVAAPLWFLAVVVAVVASAGEFQHRTIQPTLLQIPHRGRLLLAKTLAAAAYGAIITLLGTLSAIVVGLISMHITGTPTGPLHPNSSAPSPPRQPSAPYGRSSPSGSACSPAAPPSRWSRCCCGGSCSKESCPSSPSNPTSPNGCPAAPPTHYSPPTPTSYSPGPQASSSPPTPPRSSRPRPGYSTAGKRDDPPRVTTNVTDQSAGSRESRSRLPTPTATRRGRPSRSTWRRPALRPYRTPIAESALGMSCDPDASAALICVVPGCRTRVSRGAASNSDRDGPGRLSRVSRAESSCSRLALGAAVGASRW